MKIIERLEILKQRYAKARRNHQERESIAREMMLLVLKQMKREIRQDRKADRHAHC